MRCDSRGICEVWWARSIRRGTMFHGATHFKHIFVTCGNTVPSSALYQIRAVFNEWLVRTRAGKSRGVYVSTGVYSHVYVGLSSLLGSIEFPSPPTVTRVSKKLGIIAG